MMKYIFSYLIQRLAALEIEIELLSLLKHKNIVSYYGMERDKSSVNIFLEYVAGIHKLYIRWVTELNDIKIWCL